MVFVAVHPTVLAAATPIYSADFVGYAMTRAERELGGNRVVAFFNGPEGDVVARRTSRDYRDMITIGRKLYEAVQDARVARELRLAGEAGRIVVRAVDPPAAGATCRRCVGDDCRAATLADRPGYGTATLGGGEDDHTLLHGLGWRTGVRDDRNHDRQGPKLPALDSRLLRIVKLTRFVAPPGNFPARIPLTVARIGDFSIAAFPTEMNTAQGHFIRKAIDRDRTRLAMVGLADEYIGYTTTSAEYFRQDYMGSSTIWGPAQGEFIECNLLTLSDLGRISNPPAVPPGSRLYFPGGSERFGLDFLGEQTPRADDELDEILLDQNQIPRRDLPSFEWREGRCDWRSDVTAMDARRVSIERLDGSTWVPMTDETGYSDDDSGFRLLVVARGRLPGVYRASYADWAAIWLAPLLDPSLAGTFRFRVATADAASKCSARFAWPRSVIHTLPEASCDTGRPLR
jgi:neutral ceramidase